IHPYLKFAGSSATASPVSCSATRRYCRPSTPRSLPMSNPSTITPSQAAQRINNGGAGRLIDVRTPIEFAAVHATGARNIPLDRLDPKALPVGDGDHPLYLI